MNPTDHVIAASYSQARARFLAAAERAGATVDSSLHPDRRGPGGEDLAIDVAQLGPGDAEDGLLVVSGTHGVEGYAGSALQSWWLDNPTDRSLPEGLRMVMIHGFNPFGFAWQRRTNEDNVDLNRNFINWETGPAPDGNPGYDRLAALLVPERWDSEAQAASTAALLQQVEELGIEAIQQVITGGQYRHPGGVFYGGTGPVWSHRWLAERAPSLFGDLSRLGIVDLHTGLGPWGVGELIVHDHRSHPVCQRAAHWWGDVRSMHDGESVSAQLTGDWLGRIGELLPGVELTAAALEFGTIDSVQVLQALRGEAWAHANPQRSASQAETARAQVRAAFLDEDPSWLETLTARFETVMIQALAGLRAAQA